MRVWLWGVGGVVVGCSVVAACVGDTPTTPGPDAGIEAGADAPPPDSGKPDDAGDAGPSLPNVAAGHLQLWLTADRGVTCVSNEVSIWSDQSPKKRDATRGSHKGPQCGITGHALAGVNLPYFSAPGSPSRDESLDVNLSFLVGSGMTVFIVERRWKDRAQNGGNAALLGTDTIDSTCDSQIFFGYAYFDGYPTLDFEPQCVGTRGQVPDASALPPSPPALDMLRLTLDAGSHEVYQNGLKVNGGGTSGTPATKLQGGSIGWAQSNSVENRFQGDIAEVVVFDVGLTDNEKQQMEAYFKAHWNL